MPVLQRDGLIGRQKTRQDPSPSPRKGPRKATEEEHRNFHPWPWAWRKDFYCNTQTLIRDVNSCSVSSLPAPEVWVFPPPPWSFLLFPWLFTWVSSPPWQDESPPPSSAHLEEAGGLDWGQNLYFLQLCTLPLLSGTSALDKTLTRD